MTVVLCKIKHESTSFIDKGSYKISLSALLVKHSEACDAPGYIPVTGSPHNAALYHLEPQQLYQGAYWLHPLLTVLSRTAYLAAL
jgi:hypothetical protein